jgi:hypothetical protein
LAAHLHARQLAGLQRGGALKAQQRPHDAQAPRSTVSGSAGIDVGMWAAAGRLLLL